ncbi:MAG: hypothetical protein QOI66_2099 [Myxococcales bacterium]|jgi:hypothetical protein|nr:hypothetical protein [Myxococcales bacterium]
MNLEYRTWRPAGALVIFGLFSTLVSVAGCLGELSPEGSEPTDVTRSALDNNDVPDGTACYQDVPMRKGVMSYGVCCFDDTDKGTSECVICDAAHHCTPGGATPGCLTGLCSEAAGSLKDSLSTGGKVMSPLKVPISRTAAFAQ